MGWIDSAHRRSEEEAVALNYKEYDKILENRIELGERIKELDKTNNIIGGILEIKFLHLSGETNYKKYNTDYYYTAGIKTIIGEIHKGFIISPSLEDKYKFSKIHNTIGFSRKSNIPLISYLRNKYIKNSFYFSEGEVKLHYIGESIYYSDNRNYIYDKSIRSINSVEIFWNRINRYSEKDKSFLIQEALPEKINCQFDIVGYYDNSDVIEYYLLIPLDENQAIEPLTTIE